MTDVHRVAVRFADLWAVDHHQMVDEIYAPSIHMEPMARLTGAPVEGSAQLHSLEDRLADMIPQHRHELIRVIAGERAACLETMVVGPTTGEFAPACVWWWLDDHRQVANEVGWFDWDTRNTDSRVSHGLVPPNDHRPRGDHHWYVRFVTDLARELLADGTATLHRVVAPDAVVEQVGVGRCDDLQGALHDLRWIEVHEVAADGSVIAVLFTGGNSELLSRGTIVLTLAGNDQILSVRAYWRWASAVPVASVHPSLHLALPPHIR
jgi:hypothetical protein